MCSRRPLELARRTPFGSLHESVVGRLCEMFGVVGNALGRGQHKHVELRLLGTKPQACSTRFRISAEADDAVE